MLEEIIEIISSYGILLPSEKQAVLKIDIWKELDIDSLEFLSLQNDLEDHFQIEIDITEFRNANTIEEILLYIQMKKENA